MSSFGALYPGIQCIHGYPRTVKPGSVILFNLTPSRFRTSPGYLRNQAISHRLSFLNYENVAEFFEERGKPITWRPALKRNSYWLRANIYQAQLRERYGKSLLGELFKKADLNSCGLGWGCLLKLANIYYQDDDSKEYKPYRYSNAKPNPKIKAKRVSQVFENYMPKIKKYIEFNTEFLSHISKYAKSKGYTLVYVDLPRDETAFPIQDEIKASYQTVISSFARDGALYWDWSREASLDENDFHDHQHVIESGREKLSKKFLEALKPLL